jgi:5-methylcytosine-specific restriction protein B
LSAVFGDLITLLGNESRGQALRLLYRDEQFFIPENVYIIGTMNTSIENAALTDYSLRRRFAFYEVSPAFESPAFIQYKNSIGSKKMDRLVKVITDLNKSISLDTAKSCGFLIGHSYFCGGPKIDDNRLDAITKYELLPLIHTYFSAQPDQDRLWTTKFTAAIKS